MIDHALMIVSVINLDKRDFFIFLKIYISSEIYDDIT